MRVPCSYFPCHRAVSHCRTCHALSLKFPSPLFSSFAVAANDLDPVRLNRDIVLHLESHILDQEGPHLIAEAVSIKMALDRDHRISLLPCTAAILPLVKCL